MTNGMDNLLNSGGKVLDIAPSVYDDALKPAVKTTGKTINLIPQAIQAALVPIRQWIAEKEYNMAETEKLLEHKLANFDPEKITTPEAYVAVPAIQSLSYAMDNCDLRELYANLLAKSMNIDVKGSVHPAFTDIIKQLSPLDANVFKIIYANETNPIINIAQKFTGGNSGSLTVFNYLTLIDIASPHDISVSLDNLSRLNLLSLKIHESYINTQLYEPFKELPIYKRYEEAIADIPDNSFEVVKGVIYNTDFGEKFHEICVVE